MSAIVPPLFIYLTVTRFHVGCWHSNLKKTLMGWVI